MSNPSGGGGGGGASYSSITPEVMNDLVANVKGAGSTLENLVSGYQSRANTLGVSSPAFAKLLELGTWATEQVPMLQRRLSLAEAMEPLNSSGYTAVQIDESDLSTLTPAEARQQAENDAKSLKDEMDDNGANGSGLDDATVDSIHANMNDPYYAAAFARAYPPGELAKVLGQLNAQEQGARQIPDPDDDPAQAIDHLVSRQNRLLEALGTTAATASRGTGDFAPPGDYAQQFLDAAGAGDADRIPAGGPASVSALLKYGHWSTTFSTDFNKGLIAYESTEDFQQRNAPGQEPWFESLSRGSDGYAVHTPDGNSANWDPMVAGMDLLGKDADASQAVLNDADTIKYLSGRDWITDHGDAYGKAVQSATTVRRGSDADGKTSAEIASHVVDSLDADDLKEDGPLANMRDSMGVVFSSYISDIDRVASQSGIDTDVPGSTNLEDTGLPNGGRWGAMFDRDHLKDVLGATETDDDAFQRISAAGLAYGTTRLDHAAGLTKSATSSEYQNAVQHDAALMGLLMSTGGVANVEEGKEKDERTQQWLDLAQGAAGMIPLPESKLLELAVSQGEDTLVSRLQTDHEGEEVDKANSTTTAMQDVLAMQTVGSLYRNGAVEVGGPEDPIASYPGGDTFASYDKDADGHRVIQLANPADLSPEDRQRMQNWLSSSGSPYTRIKPDLLSVFNDQFSRYWG